MDEKLLHKNSATAFCSSTVKLSKSFGYFMRCLSFLSICKKLQKSSLSDPTANNRINFARISAFSDLDNTKYATKFEYSKYFEIHGQKIFKRKQDLSNLCSRRAPIKLIILKSRIQESSFLMMYSLRSARHCLSCLSRHGSNNFWS